MSQITFENIEVGDGPSVTRVATTRQLVQYAAASGDYTPIHYDKDYAQKAGHERVILHGALKSSMLAEMLYDWIGENGMVTTLETSYRAVDYPEVPLTLSGAITKKYIHDGSGFLDLDIEIRNQDGSITTPGKATVSLPLNK